MSENFLATDSGGLTRTRQIRRIVTPVTATESATLYSFRVWILEGEKAAQGLKIARTTHVRRADGARTIFLHEAGAAKTPVWNERDANCI